jgi:HlyD family secretion protein
MAEKKRILIPIVVVAIIAVLGVVYLVLHSGNSSNLIRVSGNIEVTEAEMSFKIPGRVQERLVSEGDLMKAGQVVARLESTDLTQQVAMRQADLKAGEATLAALLAGSRPEEIAQAEAAMQQSQARLNEMLAGSRAQEIAGAEANLMSAKADAERAKADYERYARLFQRVNVSAQQYDAAKTAKEMAEARVQLAEEQLKLVREGPRKEEIEQTRAALNQAKERYKLVRAGPRKEDIDQARARTEAARQALALAQTQMSYATLITPMAGVVLSKNIEPGENVVPGTPVITIGDLENVWLRAYITETDIARVRVGQRATVTTDTYPDKKYEGRISFIASKEEFTPKTVQTEKERVKLVYRIKIEIKNPSMELKPGMPADAAIQLEGKQ